MAEFVDFIASELQLLSWQVENTIELLEQDNTVPFITRYRKEKTGGLNEDQIRAIQEKLAYLSTLQERKQSVKDQIMAQGKLTQELAQNIDEATQLKIVEDLYLPYRPKKRTLATMAREKGLDILAKSIWEQELTSQVLQCELSKHLDPTRELRTVEDVLAGIRHILAEIVAEHMPIRQLLRDCLQRDGVIETKFTSGEEEKHEQSKFRDYSEFSQNIRDIPPHRILAINRGEEEKALRVYLRLEESEILPKIERQVIHTEEIIIRDLLREAIVDGYQRLLYPSLCREIRRDLTDIAEQHAIDVFAQNLKKLLLTPPIRDKKILGLDPGYRTGCKWAAIDALGKLLEVGVIFPHPPQSQREEAKRALLTMIGKYNTQIIAIGNGTAHRETEEVIAEMISQNSLGIEYTIVDEAGASVYSASEQAQEEFPDLDASYRGTVSIARRLQDPLAEIVKIDPKSIGVGEYQHDVDQKKLRLAVDAVVESCVNYVGVDVNTASVPLLQRISGLNRLRARKIYEWRLHNDGFRSRGDLLKVKGISQGTFLQAAGFLKIPNGENPLDNTHIHPESYQKCTRLLQHLHIDIASISQNIARTQLHRQLEEIDMPEMSQYLEIGIPTLKDIIDNLKKPGRDPREDLPKPLLRRGIVRVEDIEIGMEFEGTVRNVVDFGAFIDIGVKQYGLVHISEMSHKFIRHPMEVVSVGDVVKVKVIALDLNRGRISLSMRCTSI